MAVVQTVVASVYRKQEKAPGIVALVAAEPVVAVVADSVLMTRC